MLVQPGSTQGSEEFVSENEEAKALIEAIEQDLANTPQKSRREMSKSRKTMLYSVALIAAFLVWAVSLVLIAGQN